MARPPTVWLRSQDNTYYTTIRGEKIKLSANKKEATRLFHERLSKHEEPAGSNISPTFRKVADLFIDESERTKKPTTFRTVKHFLQSFCDHIGAKRVADLKTNMVTRWVAHHQREVTDQEKKDRKKGERLRIPWNESTACSARSTVLACLNWAVAQDEIASHPLAKVKRGSHKRRERYLTPEERKAIRDFVKPDFRDFLTALELTGARPFSELATVTAAMVNWKANTITFEQHKNVNKGKTRTIYMTPPLAELLKRQAARHPAGPLFRNAWGSPWKSHDATRRLHHATAALKLEKASVYAFRHAYISDALGRGLSANLIAELCGNSPVTIARNYDHLHKKTKVMLEAAAKAVA